MKKIFKLFAQNTNKKTDALKKVSDSSSRKVTIEKATSFAFKSFAKTIKDLAYYDKHGKFEN